MGGGWAEWEFCGGGREQGTGGGELLEGALGGGKRRRLFKGGKVGLSIWVGLGLVGVGGGLWWIVLMWWGG